MTPHQSHRITWPKPASLVAVACPVIALNVCLLPEVIAAFVLAVAREFQVAPDLIAIPLIVALAAALGRRASILPKRNSPWQVVPNLWGLIVAISGFLKSPCIKRAIGPFIELQRSAMRTPGSLLRYYSNDATLPKLLELLVHNPAGILLLRDEISGLFAMLRRSDREEERQFYIEGWAGDSPFTMDRIQRGTIHVPHLCISVLGGIQPDRLRAFIAESSNMGTLGDGFIQRFQCSVWPDQPSEYRYIDEPRDNEVDLQIDSIFHRIAAMPAEDPAEFHFDPDAQLVFADWFERLEIRVRTEKMPEVLREHLSKYRSLMPSLALILHVVEEDDPPVEIPMHRASRAIQLCEYFESHANRVYSGVIGSVNPGAELLALRIKEGKLGSRFTIRELSEKDWSNLNTPDKARAAVKTLEDAGWVRPVPREQNRAGRPSQAYDANPRIAEI